MANIPLCAGGGLLGVHKLRGLKTRIGGHIVCAILNVSQLSNLSYVELEVYTCFSPPRSTTRAMCIKAVLSTVVVEVHGRHHTRRSNQSWPSLLAGGLRHVTAQQSVSSRGAHAQGRVLVTTACSKEGRRHGGRAASAGQPWL